MYAVVLDTPAGPAGLVFASREDAEIVSRAFGGVVMYYRELVAE